MARFLTWLFGPGRPGGSGSIPERFGDTLVDSRLGIEVLRAAPDRTAYLTAIRDLLRGLPPEKREDLVERVLVRFALYVLDLPAGEAYHHARPFGLLDHSLEVAHGVLEALSARKLHLSKDPVKDERERPPWSYAGFLAGLLHDAGKISDLEVRSEGGKSAWNAQAEPLAHFLGRSGLRESDPAKVTFREGRGLKGHEWRSGIYPVLILPPAALSYAGEQFQFAMEAYLLRDSEEGLPAYIPDVAAKIGSLIHSADKRSVTADRGRGRAPSGYVPQEKKPAPQESPPSPDPTAPGDPQPSVPEPPSSVSVARTAGLVKRFAEEFQAGIAQGQIPVNRRGGVYVTRDYYHIALPSGLAWILSIMGKRTHSGDDRVQELTESASPNLALTDLLAQHGLLVPNQRDGSWKHDVEVLPEGGEPDRSDALVLKRTSVKTDAPVFPGRIVYAEGHGPGGSQTAEPSPACAEPEPLDPDPTPPPSEPETVPSDYLPGVVRENPSPPAAPSSTVRGTRTRRLVEGSSLVRKIRKYLMGGTLRRNLDDAHAYIRPDFTWLIYPGAFKQVAQLGRATCTQDLLWDMVGALLEVPYVAPLGPKHPVIQIRLRPDTPVLKRALRLRTEKFLKRDEIATLQFWPHEIVVAEKLTSAGALGARGLAS